MIHSHPTASPGNEVAGFDTDLGASFSYKSFYVFTPKSGYIWNFEKVGNSIRLHQAQSNNNPSIFKKYVK